MPRPIAVLPVPLELLTGNRQAFKATMLEQLALGADVIVDFTGSKYVDSSGLGVLLSASRAFRQAGRQVVLCGLNADLRTLFELTKIDSLFTFYADVDAARRGLAGDWG